MNKKINAGGVRQELLRAGWHDVPRKTPGGKSLVSPLRRLLITLPENTEQTPQGVENIKKRGAEADATGGEVIE